VTAALQPRSEVKLFQHQSPALGRGRLGLSPAPAMVPVPLAAPPSAWSRSGDAASEAAWSSDAVARPPWCCQKPRRSGSGAVSGCTGWPRLCGAGLGAPESGSWSLRLEGPEENSLRGCWSGCNPAALPRSVVGWGGAWIPSLFRPGLMRFGHCPADLALGWSELWAAEAALGRPSAPHRSRDARRWER